MEGIQCTVVIQLWVVLFCNCVNNPFPPVKIYSFFSKVRFYGDAFFYLQFKPKDFFVSYYELGPGCFLTNMFFLKRPFLYCVLSFRAV
jgi:hypothetical protein